MRLRFYLTDEDFWLVEVATPVPCYILYDPCSLSLDHDDVAKQC